MGCYVLGLQEVDQTQVAMVGGKGAHLGKLSRIEGVRVPVGFCVTTDAFQRIMAEAPSIDDRLAQLSCLKTHDREAVRVLSAEIRRYLEGIVIPTIWRRSPVPSPGSASKLPMPSGPVRRRRTCRRLPSRGSRTRT
jgi:phosphoenolpyruvate synthase/pyruvate phosphate dikinase